MNQLEINAALLVLRPNANWGIRSQDLSEIDWLDIVQTRPTDDEILAQLAIQGNS